MIRQNLDQSFNDLILKIIKEGRVYESASRPGVERTEIPTYEMCIPMNEYPNQFQVITRRKTYPKLAITELLWILRGDDNIEFLIKNKVNYWNKDVMRFNGYKWDTEEQFIIQEQEFKQRVLAGDKKIAYSGKVYGNVLRNFTHNPTSGTDQLIKSIQSLRNNPESTRNVNLLYNPSVPRENMVLQSCHYAVQLIYEGDNQLSLKYIIRSWDVYLGGPADTYMYEALLMIYCVATGMKPHSVYCSSSCTHLYNGHLPAVTEYLKQPILDGKPTLTISESGKEKIRNLEFNRLEPSEFVLDGYSAGKKIGATLYEAKK